MLASSIMSGSPKEQLAVVTTPLAREEDEERAERDVFLREGRKLTVVEQGHEDLVEIRNESGQLEVRIQLTEQGPVLQMESVRLSLKAAETVDITSKSVSIHGTEQLALHGGAVAVTADSDLNVNAGGEVRIVGKMIYLN